MNEHAKSIWYAWVVHGKTVQRWVPAWEKWIDQDPTDTSINPESFPDLWRIKPQYNTVRFRIALYHGTKGELCPIIVFPCWYKNVDSHDNFIKWIGDEILIERAIEE